MSSRSGCLDPTAYLTPPPAHHIKSSALADPRSYYSYSAAQTAGIVSLAATVMYHGSGAGVGSTQPGAGAAEPARAAAAQPNPNPNPGQGGPANVSQAHAGPRHPQQPRHP
jgi:hypothetical protein